MKAIIIPNYEKDGVNEILLSLKGVLEQNKIEYIVSDLVCKSEDFDIIITIGGDGTIIHAAKAGAELNIPILGINAGRIGYLANISSNELELLSKLTKGEYFTEERMLLEVELNGNKYYCLNEAVISKGSLSRMIDIELSVDGSRFAYRADGLIASTPTGSTAYSMSAGGPVVDPGLDLFIITPICSNSLYDRPIILNGDSVIKVDTDKSQGAEIFLTVDGEVSVKVEHGDSLTIKRAKHTAKLIKIKDCSFYDTLSEKMRG